MDASRLARFVVMRASFQGFVFSEQGRHLGSCNTKQLGLRSCFLNGIKLKKTLQIRLELNRKTWNTNLQR